MGEPPASLGVVARRVDMVLEELLESESRRWTDLDSELAGPLGELARLVRSGGKR